MPWQLIYTSAPRLLTAGQTGFGTVARHRDIPALVVSAVERASQFARLPGMDSERVVCSHRIVDAAGSRFHVVSRIASAGADYTGRTNHLAHHVIVTAAEAADLAAQGMSAADVALRFPWKNSWNEGARWLEALEMPALATLWPDRQEHLSAWMEATGDALHANHLVSGTGARSGCIVIAPSRVHMLRLFVESLRALPQQGWMFTFTTELDPGDAPGDFRWLGFSPGSPVLESVQAGRRFVLDLTRPESLPVAEPLPQPVAKPSSATTFANLSGRPVAPPRVFTPAASTFVEPASSAPPPVASRMLGPMAAPPPQQRLRESAELPEGRDDAWGWRAVAFLTMGACAVLIVILFATGRLELSGRRPPPVAPVSPSDNVVPPSAPRPTPPVTETKTASSTAASTVSVSPKSDPPPSPPVPAKPLPIWRAAHASQLARLDLPELRIEQVHKLVLSNGEMRGPLVEARNKLSLTIKDPTPVVKLNYAARTAEWGNSPRLPIAPPLEWRVEQDFKEVMRVFIGDGTQQRAMSAAESATQSKDYVVTGDFAATVRKFDHQALWLRLPNEAEGMLRNCGYKGSPMVPLQDMKPDVSGIYAWVSNEMARAQSIIDAPVADLAQMSLGATPGSSLGNEPQGTKAARSKEVNTLDNVPSPSSSVAGNMHIIVQQQRDRAKKYLDVLAQVRSSPVMLGRLAPGTCSFFAGPPGSAPEEAVWICDVTFNES